MRQPNKVQSSQVRLGTEGVHIAGEYNNGNNVNDGDNHHRITNTKESGTKLELKAAKNTNTLIDFYTSRNNIELGIIIFSTVLF